MNVAATDESRSIHTPDDDDAQVTEDREHEEEEQREHLGQVHEKYTALLDAWHTMAQLVMVHVRTVRNAEQHQQAPASGDAMVVESDKSI